MTKGEAIDLSSLLRYLRAPAGATIEEVADLAETASRLEERVWKALMAGQHRTPVEWGVELAARKERDAQAFMPQEVAP